MSFTNGLKFDELSLGWVLAPDQTHVRMANLQFCESFAEGKVLILSQTLARAQPLRRAVDKPQFKGAVTDILGSSLRCSDNADEPTPQAFLVEQPPHWNLQTHFHQRHQFQVVVRGSGTLGRHPVAPFAIHYASAYSGYGPLLAGADGLSYLTLRVVSDTGAWYLPDSREHLKLRIPKQQVHAAPSLAAEQVHLLAEPQQEPLITQDEGGLAAWLLRLPAGTRAPAPAGSEAGGGRFYVVMEGSLLLPGDELEGLATVYLGRDEILELQAGARGAQVLVLQFPAAAMLPVPEPAS